ncbi:hypothetical protein Fcan01_00276 [Folsomia candida]|uniref:Uncharacterized protein n=2 Tax=Folsomia candida TaxID=158441 RepID=A0A226F695_FOLCA|nr:hypothetical protein Fcan01_00276 [Folsomia candida]
MTFLPTPDLFTSTRVNSTWENEARSHLLSRITVFISDQAKNLLFGRPSTTFQKYQQTTQVRSKYHERVELDWLKDKDFTLILPQFENFAVENKGKVRHLQLYFLPKWGINSYKIFKIFPIFGKSLTSLTLTFHYENLLEVFASLSRENLILPSVTKLNFNSASFLDHDTFATIISAISPIFPNLTHLHFLMMRWKQLEFIFAKKPHHFFPKLTSFSFLYEPNEDELSLIPPPEMFILNIAKFHFAVANYPTRRQIGPNLLRILAPVLQHFHITEVGDSVIVHIPMMPKLRVFKISRRPFKCGWSKMRLHFETEDRIRGVKINYEKQFPLLARISMKCVPFFKRGDDEENFFEATVRFLYDTFSPGNIAVCETLRELNVPLPPGDEFKFRGMRSGRDRCSGDVRNPVCNCYEWESSTTFLDHVAATFPNLQYAFLAKSKEKVRCDAVRKWVQMGVDLGLLDKSYRICEGGDDKGM